MSNPRQNFVKKASPFPPRDFEKHHYHYHYLYIYFFYYLLWLKKGGKGEGISLSFSVKKRKNKKCLILARTLGKKLPLFPFSIFGCIILIII